MKFYVETFGCQMNVADSQEMGRRLLARGFSATLDAEEADWILLNTCTVRQHAEQRAVSYIGRLREWKARDPRRRLVVAGCAAERLKDEIRARFPFIDLVAGAKSIGRFDRMLDEAFPGAFDARAEDTGAWPPDVDAPVLPGSPAAAFVTIMRGCNYSCSYCIVPAVRGRESYRPAESVLAEVRRQAAQGAGEVLLLGQTVNSYRPAGDGPVKDFADLLHAVDAVPGVRHIRFMSPHPFYLDERMARAVADCGNVCPHIHLPVQSGSDAVLRRMRRNYSRADYLARLEKLRRLRPGIAVTTDFIVGFPGETQEDFEATLSLAREADFDGAYCFKYSPRPGTEAAALPDDVPEIEKERRHARLLELCESASRQKAEALVGTRQIAVVDGPEGDEPRAAPPGPPTAGGLPKGKDRGSDRLWAARTRSSRKIFFSSEEAHRPGDTVEVAVTAADGRSLRGRAGG